MKRLDHLRPPRADGSHPDCPGLVYAEAELHYSMVIVTVPGRDGDLLVSWEDWAEMVGDADVAEQEFGYICDEYLKLFQKGDD